MTSEQNQSAKTISRRQSEYEEPVSQAGRQAQQTADARAAPGYNVLVTGPEEPPPGADEQAYYYGESTDRSVGSRPWSMYSDPDKQGSREEKKPSKNEYAYPDLPKGKVR
jgi:hypothetical protein